MRRPRSARTGPAAVLVAIAVLALPACQAATVSWGASAGSPATSTAPSAAPSPAAMPTPVISVDPPLGATDVDPVTPLRVLAGHGTLDRVTVTATDGHPLAGELSTDGRSWVAGEPLAYGTSYTVLASARNAAGRATTASGAVGTVTPRTLTLPSVFPNEDHPVVGVGQPIAVTFDEDITDRAAVQRQLHVTTTPPVAGAWSWLSDRVVHYRPQEFWPAHTHVVVEVDVYGLDVGNGVHGQADRHVEFDIGARKVATVDAGELVLRLYVDDQLVREMPTSLGKNSTPTPSGTYVVMAQARRYTMDSSTYGLPVDAPGGYRTEVEYASRLSGGGIFVHGAPWSVRDQGRRNVSHGCLNVSVADAGWFFANFGRGDVVAVTGGGATLEVGDGFGDWNVSWEQWLAGSALPHPA